MRKSQNQVIEEVNHFHVFPKCQRKKNKTLDFLPCDRFAVHPKSASHLALGEGVGGGGVYSASPAQRPNGRAPREIGAGEAAGCARSLSLSAARPAPGARPTWRCRRPLCCPLRPRRRAAARRDSCGRRRGRRGGGAGRQPCPPAGRGARGALGRGRGEPAAAPRSRDPRSRGRDGRGTSAAPPSRREERGPRRGPRPRARSCPHAGFRQLAAIATRPQKVSRRPERLERKFSLAPHSLSPTQGLRQAAGNQSSRRAASRVHLLHPWPRLRAQGGCPALALPAPSQGQASRDAARPTHHGDSRSGRASAGSGCRGAGAGTQAPGRTSKVGPLRQKQALDTQALTGANGNPGGTPSRRDRRR